MTWDEILKRDDLVGGDLETQEDGDVYRGPLEKIERQGDMIRFSSPWTARMLGSQPGSWEKWHITSCSVTADVKPQDIGDGRICFTMPFLGHGVIFPKGGSKLDPAKVKGLEIPS